jgi:hypothetical protein
VFGGGTVNIMNLKWVDKSSISWIEVESMGEKASKTTNGFGSPEAIVHFDHLQILVN